MEDRNMDYLKQLRADGRTGSDLSPGYPPAKWAVEEIERLTALKEPKLSEIKEAVRAVLATDEWPIHYTYDDAGLEEDEYVKFVLAVIKAVKDKRATQ